MKIERVVVTGGRHFHDVQRVLADLRALQVVGLVAVAQGGAAGADACARNSCDVLKIQCQTYPALWETDGRGAGPRRNIRMLEAERPDLVLAYPDPNSRGTWHCVRAACDRGMTVAIFAPFVEMYDFMGEDSIKPGIYVDGPKGNIMRIDDQRRESHGRASDGGWANLELIENPPWWIIGTFDNRDTAEWLSEALR